MYMIHENFNKVFKVNKPYIFNKYSNSTKFSLRACLTNQKENHDEKVLNEIIKLDLIGFIVTILSDDSNHLRRPHHRLGSFARSKISTRGK